MLSGVVRWRVMYILLSFRSTEKLEGEKLNVAEVTQSEIAQKQKLQTVLERINDSIKVSTRSIRWNVDCKNSTPLAPFPLLITL